MAKEIILGIDLGTTNSVVSYLQADGTVKVIPNPEGTMTTPSVVAFRPNGEENIVKAVYSKGYRLHDRMIRPANVAVSVHKKEKNDSEPESDA